MSRGGRRHISDALRRVLSSLTADENPYVMFTAVVQYDFTDIQGSLTGSGTILLLPQCQ